MLLCLILLAIGISSCVNGQSDVVVARAVSGSKGPSVVTYEVIKPAEVTNTGSVGTPSKTIPVPSPPEIKPNPVSTSSAAKSAIPRPKSIGLASLLGGTGSNSKSKLNAGEFGKLAETLGISLVDSVIQQGKVKYYKDQLEAQAKFYETFNPQYSQFLRSLPPQAYNSISRVYNDNKPTTGNSWLDLLRRNGLSVGPPRSLSQADKRSGTPVDGLTGLITGLIPNANPDAAILNRMVYDLVPAIITGNTEAADEALQVEDLTTEVITKLIPGVVASMVANTQNAAANNNVKAQAREVALQSLTPDQLRILAEYIDKKKVTSVDDISSDALQLLLESSKASKRSSRKKSRSRAKSSRSKSRKSSNKSRRRRPKNQEMMKKVKKVDVKSKTDYSNLSRRTMELVKRKQAKKSMSYLEALREIAAERKSEQNEYLQNENSVSKSIEQIDISKERKPRRRGRVLGKPPIKLSKALGLIKKFQLHNLPPTELMGLATKLGLDKNQMKALFLELLKEDVSKNRAGGFPQLLAGQSPIKAPVFLPQPFGQVPPAASVWPSGLGGWNQNFASAPLYGQTPNFQLPYQYFNRGQSNFQQNYPQPRQEVRPGQKEIEFGVKSILDLIGGKISEEIDPQIDLKKRLAELEIEKEHIIQQAIRNQRLDSSAQRPYSPIGRVAGAAPQNRPNEFGIPFTFSSGRKVPPRPTIGAGPGFSRTGIRDAKVSNALQTNQPVLKPTNQQFASKQQIRRRQPSRVKRPIKAMRALPIEYAPQFRQATNRRPGVYMNSYVSKNNDGVASLSLPFQFLGGQFGAKTTDTNSIHGSMTMPNDLRQGGSLRATARGRKRSTTLALTDFDSRS